MNWCHKCGRYTGESIKCFCKLFYIAHENRGYTKDNPTEVWGADIEFAAERYAYLYNEASREYSMMNGDCSIEIEISPNREEWKPATVTASTVIQYSAEI